MLTQNVGGIDRILRVVLGLIGVVAGFAVLSGTGGVVLGALGIVFLVTGLIGWCPLYLPFRFSTKKA